MISLDVSLMLDEHLGSSHQELPRDATNSIPCFRSCHASGELAMPAANGIATDSVQDGTMKLENIAPITELKRDAASRGRQGGDAPDIDRQNVADQAAITAPDAGEP